MSIYAACGGNIPHRPHKSIPFTNKPDEGIYLCAGSLVYDSKIEAADRYMWGALDYEHLNIAEQKIVDWNANKPTFIDHQGEKVPSVLEEAQGLIYGDRQQQYGNAEKNFKDIGLLWAPILGMTVSPEEVALCLLQLKVARAINDTRQGRPIKRDTVVDLAGYAGCIEKIQKGV